MSKLLQNEEYEKCILAIMLIDNSVIDLIASEIKVEMFYFEIHKKLYTAILKQYEEKQCVDALILSKMFGNDMAKYITSLTDVTVTTYNWQYYCTEVKNCYLSRCLKQSLSETIESLSSDSVIDSIHNLDSSLTNYMKYDSGKPSNVKDLVMTITEDIDKAFQENKELLGYDTGWRNLNDIIDGLQPGKLVVIGARPSVGKTAFSNQLISNLCKNGISSCIFSLEMTSKMLLTRMIASESGLSIFSILHGDCARYETGLRKLNIALTKIYEYPLTIFDNGLKNEKELYSRIRVEAKTKGTKVFLVDHIGLLKYSNPNTKRVEALDDITQGLLHLAQELNVCIIILSQLKRDAEGKKPTLADLRDSGSIEQNADIAMFIHRDRASSTNDTEIPTEIIVIKNRDGSCGTANMLFFPKCTKFTEVLNNDRDINE